MVHPESTEERGLSATLRQAVRADIPAMHLVRLAVRENVLTSNVSEQDYVPAIEQTGRGWVIEAQDGIAGFSVGNAKTGNIWALFVDPAQEHKGYGRRLHDVMVEWLFEQGLSRLYLGTQPDTRAERFYLAAGWRPTGVVDGGEVEFELRGEWRRH